MDKPDEPGRVERRVAQRRCGRDRRRSALYVADLPERRKRPDRRASPLLLGLS